MGFEDINFLSNFVEFKIPDGLLSDNANLTNLAKLLTLSISKFVKLLTPILWQFLSTSLRNSII
jgi:hypothetical protein